MSKNLDSVTALTEFAPLSPEEKNVGVSFLFSKLFRRGPNRDGSPDSGSTPDHLTTQSFNAPREFSLGAETWQNRDADSDSSSSRGLSSLPFPIYADMGDGRSLPNVLKRISNLLAMKSSGFQAYKDTDFKQYWMPDSVSKECYDCGDRFTTFRRRHHCRVCGQIFCSRCCNQEIPGKIMGCTGDLRVCTYCCKVVLSYLQSPDIGADLSADLRAVQEDLQSKFGESSSSLPALTPQSTQSPIEIGRERNTRTLSRRKYSYQEDRFAMGRHGNLAASSTFLSSEDVQLSAEERWKTLQSSSSLRALWEYMRRRDTGIPLQTHRYRLRSFPSCFVGTQLVDWLLANSKAATMTQAVALGQALINAGFIECISHMEPIFHDGYALYRLKHPSAVMELSPPASPPAAQSNMLWAKDEVDLTQTDSEPEMVEVANDSLPSSSSTFYLDLNVQENRVQLRRPRQSSEREESSEQASKTLSQEHTGISRKFLTDTLLVEGSETRELVPSMGWHLVQNLRTDNGEKEAYSRLSEAFEQHERCLLQQLLSAEGLSQSWGECVAQLTHQVVELVRPDVRNDSDDMDLRQYVQFKKVSGGSRSESCVVSGVVCTKNVAHRSMSTHLTNPHILLLGCSIIYERVEGRFLSLEPLMMQEQDYLKNAVARIVSLQPDIVLVERTVSRLAQDLLLEQGITLIINVKPSVLERLARLTQADILTCVDAHVGKPRIGMCHNFYLRHFQTNVDTAKTLMFFDGCATHLGCTVILRGGSADELKRLKRVIAHLILVNYSWRHEKSFLMDEFAMPPPSANDSFFNEDELSVKDVSDSVQDSGQLAESKASSDVSVKKSGDKSEASCDKKAVSDRHKVPSRTSSREKGIGAGQEEIKIEAVMDQSDPLHQYLAGDVGEAAGTEQLAVATLPLANRFRKALDGTVLSSSPYLQYTVPFLESEAGRNCALRKFFPEQIYWSLQLLASSNAINETQNTGGVKGDEQESDVFRSAYHPFVHARLTKCVESWEIQALLASFRACGGRLQHPQASEAAGTPTSDAHLERPVDALSPVNHQRLTVLFCSFSSESNNAPAFCVNPWVVQMELYGRNDIPLGQFLQQYCFRKSYTCPSPTCSTPMLRHVRRFVHDGGCIQVALKELDCQIPVEGNAILMWSWCSVCKLVSPVVPMSVDTWSLSFAKYLELRFHGNMFTRRGKDQPCPHPLHHDHYQYFGFKDVVVSFKFSTVLLWEISLPPSTIVNSIRHNHAQGVAIEEIKQLALKGYEVFSIVLEKLCSLEAEASKAEGISSFKAQLKREQAYFKSKIEEVQIKLTCPTFEFEIQGGSKNNEDVSRRLWDIEDCLVQLKKIISEAVAIWNARIAELSKKKEEKSKKSNDGSKQTHSSTDTFEDTSSETSSPNIADNLESTVLESADSSAETAPGEVADVTSLSSSSEACNECAGKKHSLDEPGSETSRGHERSFSEGAGACLQDETFCRSERRSVPQVPPAATVKQIFSHILLSNMSTFIIPNPFHHQEHYLLSGPPSQGPNIVVYEKEPSSIIAYALCSTEYHKKLHDTRQQAIFPDGAPPSPIETKRKSQDTLSGELVTSVESTKRTMLSFLRGGSPNLANNRHPMLIPKAADAEGALCADEDSFVDANSTFMEGKGRPSSKQGSSDNYIEVQFADATTSFQCRVYLAEQFEALRSIVCPEGEEMYARSLSRCVQWAARGGKSGSAFAKTKDDRYILKEMTQHEVHLFLEIAPNYLNYIRKALEAGQPTLLGKIVGVYRVSYRGMTGTSTMKNNFLVMENLFYGRSITQRFDLKGSQRNRLVETSQQGGEIVLLDENLLKMSCESPLYIHPHSKMVLTQAIEKDTKFLSSQAVMDYSLLVGLDETKKELVLGIIDYVRTFTWDKKLETMVKSSGFLGGQGKTPTIVSPEVYQARFIAAMHKYFLPVPDRWTGLGTSLGSVVEC